MRRQQLELARRGVDLLLADLKGVGDSFHTALSAKDAEMGRRCADPLVTVATILIRLLRDATSGTITSTLELVRPRILDELADDPETQTDLESIENLIACIVSARPPSPISTDSLMVALLAQEIAKVAADELAKIEGRHINEVVANLRIKLKQQGDDVQLSDRDAASALAAEYIVDPEMRQARRLANHKIVNHWNDVAKILHEFARDETLTTDCRETLIATALMTSTCAAVTGGIVQLASQGNLYPATTLLRQLVEVEFIFWKFSQGVTEMQEWLRSTPDERRQSWRPATIYRDTSNDFRQKDYDNHCEFGGHPTPAGARIAAGIGGDAIEAGILADLIGHSADAWRWLMEVANIIDTAYATNAVGRLSEPDSAFESTLQEHAEIDLYGYGLATAFFADPS
ncbi:hypothetical protein [Mycolicibacterium gadium]|uniref:hypothetical protein n=1 Tax=Mycolicibacterium gadium TaxID=1794 RepID=UPI002FDD0785